MNKYVDKIQAWIFEHKLYVIAGVFFFLLDDGSVFTIRRSWFVCISIIIYYHYDVERKNSLRYNSLWYVADGVKDSSILPPLRLSGGWVARSLGDLPNDLKRGQNGTIIAPLETSVNLNKSFVNLGYAKIFNGKSLPKDWIRDLEENDFNTEKIFVCFSSMENMSKVQTISDSTYSKIDLASMYEHSQSFSNEMQQLLENKNLVIQSEMDYHIGKSKSLNEATQKPQVIYSNMNNENKE